MTQKERKEREKKNRLYKPCNVGDNIKKIRLERGYSMMEMAILIDRNYDTYEKIEAGASTQVDIIMIIAQKLDVSVDFLLKNQFKVTPELIEQNPYYNRTYMTPVGELEIN